jgi:hypothetical protein
MKCLMIVIGELYPLEFPMLHQICLSNQMPITIIHDYACLYIPQTGIYQKNLENRYPIMRAYLYIDYACLYTEKPGKHISDHACIYIYIYRL